MITKGSSGSYFARAELDGRVQTVACVLFLIIHIYVSSHRLFSVFKPKDEEPYGRLNPKVYAAQSLLTETKVLHDLDN